MTHRRSIIHVMLFALVMAGAVMPTRQARSLAVNPRVACGSISFSAATNFATAAGPNHAALGDFDGNGVQDLVTANSSGNVSVLLGAGGATFGTHTDFSMGTDPRSVVVGDFNGDARQDVAAAGFGQEWNYIRLGTGLTSPLTSMLGTIAVYDTGVKPSSVVAADFNGDGKLDLVTANTATSTTTDNSVSIRLGAGDGTFGTGWPTKFAMTSQPMFVVAGDLNGDGKQDVVTADYGSSKVSIRLGDGTGSFGPVTSISVGTNPRSLALSDLNADGKLDLVVTNYGSGNVSILVGNGTGGFSAPTNFPAGSGPDSVAVGDFNGDGSKDLAVANSGSNNVSILSGNGNGNFGAAINFGVGSNPTSVLVSDFNSDGKQDLAVTNNGSNNVAILLNNCDSTVPTVTTTNLQAFYKTRPGPDSFTVTFTEDVNNPVGNTDTDDVTNTANYLLLEDGENDIVDTVSCAAGRAGDDLRIPVSSVAYTNPTATVTLASPLEIGRYRLFVCGTTSIKDLGNNTLGGGVDYIFDFAVGQPKLPRTGFAPNRITSLPVQSDDLAYTNMGDIWLEIPSINVESNIIGVPQVDNNWDVTWLGNDAGWLNGTTFPSWEGNSVITAHVTDANGQPGPFAKLKDMKHGDRVIVHMYGEKYIFEVRATRMVKPSSTEYAFKHLDDYSYLTLITCQGYNPMNGSYLFRRIVRAVLVDVQSE